MVISFAEIFDEYLLKKSWQCCNYVIMLIIVITYTVKILKYNFFYINELLKKEKMSNYIHYFKEVDYVDLEY